MLKIKENATILFQGDSVTDADRVRVETEKFGRGFALGRGYPLFVAGYLSAFYPNYDLTFYNKGISGNRVKDLEARWTEDCIDLKPDLVSILIGINDTWRRYDSNDPTSTEAFESGYRRILERVKNETDADILLLTPFVLPYPEDRKAWREDLDPKIEAVERLAKEFDADLIQLDNLFKEKCSDTHPTVWTPDGVHPSPAGHTVIASAWLNAMGVV